jgi:ATP-binding cassette subfamily B protein
LTEEDIGQTIREVGKNQEVMTIRIAHRLIDDHACRPDRRARTRKYHRNRHPQRSSWRREGLYYAMWRQQIGEKRATPVAVPPQVAACRGPLLAAY